MRSAEGSPEHVERLFWVRVGATAVAAILLSVGLGVCLTKVGHEGVASAAIVGSISVAAMVVAVLRSSTDSQLAEIARQADRRAAEERHNEALKAAGLSDRAGFHGIARRLVGEAAKVEKSYRGVEGYGPYSDATISTKVHAMIRAATELVDAAAVLGDTEAEWDAQTTEQLVRLVSTTTEELEVHAVCMGILDLYGSRLDGTYDALHRAKAIHRSKMGLLKTEVRSGDGDTETESG